MDWKFLNAEAVQQAKVDMGVRNEIRMSSAEGHQAGLFFPLWVRIVCHDYDDSGIGNRTRSAFTSGSLFLCIIDHYHLCDLQGENV